MAHEIPREVSLPSLPVIHSDIPQDLREWIEAASVIIEVLAGLGARGTKNELDRAVTRRDMLTGGLAEALVQGRYLVPDTEAVPTTSGVRTIQNP